jgi:peptide-methionine (S)-S-oxide reductase
VFQLDFDPTQLSYGELLDQIWANRRGGRSYGRQYMEVVLPANAEQERVARERGISVPIITGARFWPAEDYHQKYYLRHDSTLMRELAGYSPQQLVDSTVAARLNGYVAGRTLVAPDQIAALGLSTSAMAYLERLVAR